jgi:hypothetical protein
VYVVSAHLVGEVLHQTAFEAGQQVRLDLAVLSGAVAVDPGSLTLKTRAQGSASLTQTVLKDAVGQYHYDLVAVAGVTAVTWTGTGANPGAASFAIHAVPALVT